MDEKAVKDKTIATQYAKLNRFHKNGEHERALKAANKIWGISPFEFSAFHCKIVCLIKLSKFEEALSLMNKNPQCLQQLIFEKAYCYYRANKFEDALKTIEQNEHGMCESIRELNAQILYRLEKYSESSQLYQDIIKRSNDDYENERYANLSATMVYMSSGNTPSQIAALKGDTYELCFNKACILIAEENYDEAEKKLLECEKLYRDILEEDEATEEEINVELALVRIQMAYVYQKQERIKECQKLYISNMKRNIEDITLMATASNNILCINKDQNLFDSKKKMKVALSGALTYNLVSKQRKFITLNNAILNYYLHQPDTCEKICGIIDKTWPELSVQTNILRALNLIKLKKNKEAFELLEIVKTKSTELHLNLCIVQLHLMQDERLQACKVLENLGDDSYTPGIVGALTTLYLALDEEALQVSEKNMKSKRTNLVKSANLSSMWRQAAEYHIRKCLPHVAANSLEEFLKANSSDTKTTAQLVLACSQFDKSMALQLSQILPSINELATDVDLESLQTPAATTVKYTKKPGVTQESLPSTSCQDSGKKPKKHKNRKRKLPKNYDPNVPPNPERWLPYYERTGYKKKKDRWAKEVMKGSQGTASGEVQKFDYSNNVEDASEASGSKAEHLPKSGKAHHQQQEKKSQQKRRNKCR